MHSSLEQLDAVALADCDSRGGLHVLLKALFKRQQELMGPGDDVLAFDFKDVPRCLDLLRVMGAALASTPSSSKAGGFRRPKLFFDRSVTGARLYRLRKLAKLHGATLTHAPEEASHVVQYSERRDGEAAANRTKHSYAVSELGSVAAMLLLLLLLPAAAAGPLVLLLLLVPWCCCCCCGGGGGGGGRRCCGRRC